MPTHLPKLKGLDGFFSLLFPIPGQEGVASAYLEDMATSPFPQDKAAASYVLALRAAISSGEFHTSAAASAEAGQRRLTNDYRGRHQLDPASIAAATGGVELSETAIAALVGEGAPLERFTALGQIRQQDRERAQLEGRQSTAYFSNEERQKRRVRRSRRSTVLTRQGGLLEPDDARGSLLTS